MQSDKRFFLAFAITVAFLYVWFEFFAPKPKIVPKPKEQAQTTQNTTEPTTPSQSVAKSTQKIPEEKAVQIKPKLIKTQNNVFVVTWTNQSGAPKRVELKKYRKAAPKGADPFAVVPVGGQETVPSYWQFKIEDQVFTDKNVMYSVEHRASLQKIRFFSNLADDLRIEKVYTWTDDAYVLNETIEIFNQSDQPKKIIATKIIAGTKPKKESKGSFLMKLAPQSSTKAVAMIGDEVQRWDFDDINKETEVPSGAILWAGFDTHYFVFAHLPEKGRWESLSLKEMATDGGMIKLMYPRWDINAGSSQSFSLQTYAGPKEISILEKVAPSFEEAIDLGSWLGVIARPILSLLKKLHSLIPNYGVAIILLTIMVRLLLFPLTQMQARSMKKMQLHKPQMDALKEKHGDNKEQYSRELMTYMRTHKINPAGGCLLLLPQLPIFFALYRVLYNSIELRHEPFIGWIADLSAHDPFYVMPVLLGITMFFQQKLTPTPTADPAQQAMMKFMPIMFSVFMVFLPAGLNLYIFVSTLWGVAQQYWIQKDAMGGTQVLAKEATNKTK